MRFLLMLALVLSQGPTPSSGKGKGQPPKGQATDHQQQATQTTSTTPATLPPTTRERPYNSATSGNSKPSPDWWMIGVTGGLLIVAAFQVGLFWRQLNIMNDSLADAKKAAEAALIGANAAKASVDAATGTERAYLFFDTVETANRNRKKSALDVGGEREIVLTNYGKTPAIVSRMCVALAYRTTIEEVKNDLRLGPRQMNFSAMAITPNGRLPRVSIPLEASAVELAAAKEGKGRIYVFGNVEYRDVFGNSHRTGFCGGYNFKSGVFAPVGDADLNYNT